MASLAQLLEPEANLSLLWIAALVMARMAPLVVLAPWLSLRVAPGVVSVVVTAAITAALLPVAALGATPPTDGWQALMLAPRELLIGAVYAVAVSLPFYALDWAGQLLDRMRGAGSLRASTAGGDSSPLGVVHLWLGIVVFLSLGGHRAAIGELAGTFAAAPVGVSSWPADAALGDLAQSTARLLADAFGVAVLLSAPLALVLLVMDFVVGWAARGARALPLHFAMMPLRALLGLAVALLSLSVLVGQLPGWLRGVLDAAAALLEGVLP